MNSINIVKPFLHECDCHFALCESCFWCASCFFPKTSTEEDDNEKKIIICPSCKIPPSLIPLNRNESYVISMNASRGLEIQFSKLR